MKLLAIPATNSVGGMNRQLLGHVEALLGELSPETQLTILDLNDFEMPMFSPALEASAGPPPAAHELFKLLGEADGLVISFAEYNGSYTPVWKNAFDWMSRIDQSVYHDNPVVMLAASPGPRAGAGVLGSATTAAPFFGAKLVGSMGVGSFFSSFNGPEDGLADANAEAQLRALLTKLIASMDQSS